MIVSLLLVPADTVSPHLPDEQFAAEAEAARARDLAVALVNHDELSQPHAAAKAVRRVATHGNALYRGWMLSSNRYEEFTTALAARDVTLVTSADAYRTAHELPNWYPALAAHTPLSYWTQAQSQGRGHGREQEHEREIKPLLHIAHQLASGAAILRDYVKSAKHYWDDACYIPHVDDDAQLTRAAQRFVELRDTDFTGGFVLRRFENFVGAEARSWWVDGECRLITAHPDSPAALPPNDLDVTAFAPAIRSLNLRFVSVDLKQNTDGNWRIIELGDGQVSDRPTSIAAEDFLAALLR